MKREDCSKPIWANAFCQKNGATVYNRSHGFHGLPRVGDTVDADGCGDLFGKVTSVNWAPTTSAGELKPTIWVEVQ